MVKSISERDLPKKILFETLFSLSLLLFFTAAPVLNGFERAEKNNAVKNILLVIHKEVLELGKRENEDFIKREFHIDLDGNSLNQEEHVVVLSQTMCDRDLMTVQVTYFQSKDNIIRYPKDVKIISCYIKDKELEIKESGYTEKECKHLLSKILEGIRVEKKLLKLIDLD